MKNFLAPAKFTLVAAAILLCLAASPAFAQAEQWNPNASPLPTPTGPVNDFAGVLDQATIDRLNQRLTEYQRSTGVELAVAVVRTTGDRPIFDYSLAVARGWGIGSKGDDNPSALLFIAVDDRKYFTQVSRDLEDELPDALAGSLQRQFLVPEFRQQNYGKGISDTIEAYISTIDQRSSGTAASPTPVPTGEPGGVSGRQSLSSGFCCLAVIFIILLIIFSNRGGGGRRGGWGGGFGGGGGSVLPWIIGSAIANAASSSSSSSSWGGSSDWGGGGGSDWGGFGGGGDFGGGGAGGDW